MFVPFFTPEENELIFRSAGINEFNSKRLALAVRKWVTLSAHKSNLCIQRETESSVLVKICSLLAKSGQRKESSYTRAGKLHGEFVHFAVHVAVSSIKRRVEWTWVASRGDTQLEEREKPAGRFQKHELVLSEEKDTNKCLNLLYCRNHHFLEQARIYRCNLKYFVGPTEGGYLVIRSVSRCWILFILKIWLIYWLFDQW